MKILSFINSPLKQVFVLMVLALIFRLALAPLAYNNDVYTQAAWGEWMYQHGFAGTYANSQWKVAEWPNHPPLITLWYGLAYHFQSGAMWLLSSVGVFIASHRLGAPYIPWYFNFIKWYGSAKEPLSLFSSGIFFTIKFLPILADLLTGGLVYSLVKKANATKAVLFTALYLFSPFSWYLSALWGQTDQLGSLILLGSFLLLFNKRITLSTLLFTIAASFKPTVLIMAPLYLFLLLQKKVTIFQFVVGGIVSLLFLFITVYPFDTEVIKFSLGRLPEVLFHSKGTFSSASALNFWHILFGLSGKGDADIFLLLPIKIWGYIIFAAIHIYVFKRFHMSQLKGLLYAVFIVSFGGWLFLSNMYDRYLFLAIISGLICTAFNKKLLVPWLCISTIYFFNLLHSWAYPPQLEGLRHMLTTNESFIGKLLAMLNISLYMHMIKTMQQDSTQDILGRGNRPGNGLRTTKQARSRQ